VKLARSAPTSSLGHWLGASIAVVSRLPQGHAAVGPRPSSSIKNESYHGRQAAVSRHW